MAVKRFLQEIKDRLAASTPGPWLGDSKPEQDHHVFFIHHDNGSRWLGPLELATVSSGGNEYTKEDAALIVHAPTDLARLIAAVEVADAVLGRIITQDKRLPDFTDNPQTLIASEARAEIAAILKGETNEKV